MSEWSVWSQCSCESQRQQRYRVALVPVTRGQQCTPVETQSRSCSLSECGGEWISVVKVLWPVRHLYKKKISAHFHNCYTDFVWSRKTNVSSYSCACSCLQTAKHHLCIQIVVRPVRSSARCRAVTTCVQESGSVYLAATAHRWIILKHVPFEWYPRACVKFCNFIEVKYQCWFFAVSLHG